MSRYTVKYYKGLGTSTPKEAKEYFAALEEHEITFERVDGEDDAAIDLAFNKKKAEARKEWLTTYD
jgi:DNA topoisomerase II